MSRANTRVVKIGDRVIGGGNPILIQSMTNTKTEDVEATVKQIQALTEAGFDISDAPSRPWRQPRRCPRSKSRSRFRL